MMKANLLVYLSPVYLLTKLLGNYPKTLQRYKKYFILVGFWG